MSKKFLCFMLTLCMLMQAFGMVSFASEEMLTDEIILENDTFIEEDFDIELAAERFSKEYANDDFATGTDGWIVGETANETPTTMTVVDVEGAEDGKALKITFPVKAGFNYGSDKNAVYGNVTKQGIGNGTEFSTEEELTIKARIKKTDSAMSFQIKGNRPNTIVQVGHDYEWKFHYSLLEQEAAAGGVGLSSDGVQSVGSYGSDFWGYHSPTVSNASKVDLTGKWVEYTIRFVPQDQKYYVTIKYIDTDGTEKTLVTNQTGYMRASKPELLKEYGDDFVYDKSIRQYFGGLKSLTFTSRTAGDIYVDYVKVYGDRERVNAVATVSETVTPSSNIVVNFAGGTIPSFPEGAVTVDGVECDIIPDVENQKIIFAPVNKLTPGDTHTVRIDSDAFLDKEGVTIDGQTEFTVNVDYAQAVAEMASPSIVSANDSVAVKITSTETISSFPEGLVTIDGVECTATSDIENQTITLTPATRFTAGEEYIIKIDTEMLKTECGSILNGDSTFSFFNCTTYRI